MTRFGPVLLLTALLAPPGYGQLASYFFDNGSNRYAAAEAMRPDLTPVGATANLSFVTDTVVLGATTYSNRAVLDRAGSGVNQAGVQVGTSGLLTSPNVYSVETVFSFTGNTGYSRVVNSDNATDVGLYTRLGHTDLYNTGAGTGTFLYGTSTYNHVVLTYDGINANVYLNGLLDHTAAATTTPANTDELFRFFLDNLSGGATGEYDTGRVASIRLWDTPLTAGQVSQAYANPFSLVPVPEPAGLLAVAAGLLAVRRLRRPVDHTRAAGG